MNNTKIPQFFSLLLDFLFPTPESVKIFEKDSTEESAAELTRRLPPSEPIGLGSFAIFDYSDEAVKHLIWEIKYYRNMRIAEAVGRLLAREIEETLGSFPENRPDKPFLVVPIPLTSRRLNERGFNHTEMIAQAVLKNLPPENFNLAGNIIKKIRHTPKQSSIENREDRFQNIVGAFGVIQPESVKNQSVIIIDDVITTGATVAEAKRVLMEAGARQVWAFAIGH